MSLVIAQHTSLTMQQIDPCDSEVSLEEMARQQEKVLRTANAIHVGDNDRFKRSVHCIVFMITGGRIPSIKEMTMDEYGLKSTSDIDPKDLILSSKMCEKKGLVSMGRFIEHT
jgi:hypothetical protein